MEKVKLTKEQAERIEELREKHKSNFMIIRNASFTDPRDKVTFDDTDQLVKALYFGYEIKEQYKKGDWVKAKDDGRLIKLIHDFMVEEANGSKNHLIEPATEKEISIEWWRRNGREHWELKKGDVLISKKLGRICTFDGHHNDMVYFKETPDSYQFDYVKNCYKVVCFAHERKDI